MEQSLARAPACNGARIPRTFRFPSVPAEDRDRVHLVRERVACGKRSCRCARGLKHGPYWYLRYEQYDRAADAIRYRREYVPRSELRRVRRWVQREQAENAQTRGVLTLLRRMVSQEAARERAALRHAKVQLRWPVLS